MKQRAPVLNLSIFPSFKCREKGRGWGFISFSKPTVTRKEDYEIPWDSLCSSAHASVELGELFLHTVKPWTEDQALGDDKK